uniref:Chemokine (C-C motif) ligand 36, duplicate 1 n=1 Tax=Cyprinus carpio TaxID=7962 RepID=A0A8C1U5D1_CYPCA
MLIMKYSNVIVQCIYYVSVLCANLPSECCFNNYGRKIPIAKIDSYIETRVDCPKPGVIKNLLYCVNKISVWSNCDLFLLPVLSQRGVFVCARILSWAG